MTDTSALRAFIEARLAEDERLALATGENATWSVEHRMDWANDRTKLHPTCASGNCECCVIEGSNGMRIYDEGGHDNDDAEHIARHDPARVLREVAAKRAILTLAHMMMVNLEIDIERAHGILAPLASVWSDHPDYRPEWSTV